MEKKIQTQNKSFLLFHVESQVVVEKLKEICQSEM